MSRKKQGRRKARRPAAPPTSPPAEQAVSKEKQPEARRWAQKYPWRTAALLATVVLLVVYSVCLSSPTFIAHDESVLRLPVLSHVRNVPHIFSRDFLLFTSGQFRPFSYAVLSVARTFVASDNILFWHVWLLAFHVLNTLLVFAIARHFTTRLPVTLTAAAVFALHPLCTVIVNDINLFYMLFGVTLALGCVKAYLSFSRTRRKGVYLLAVALFILAVLTARPAHSLVLLLLAYELLYERSRLRRVFVRTLPFVLILLSLLPLWLWHTPHPLHYKYVPMYKGSLAHGFFSVTGATQQYAGGLVLTRGIPVVLDETVEKVFRPNHPKFLVWGAVNLVLVVAAGFALARKKWVGVGILLIFISMIPYASVAYNRVIEYASWSYLYFPVVGLALFLAGVHDLLGRVRPRHLKAAFQVAFPVIFLFLGARSLQLNLYARSPLTYWEHVRRLNPKGERSVFEIGKAHLARGEVPQALHLLFSPAVHDLKRPSLLMSRYYCDRGNYLASAIHLRFGGSEERTGLILEDYCEAAGELLWRVGALDHAEENFGNILMVDPFNTAAMKRLAQVWFEKGFVSEAHRMLERARVLAPNDRGLGPIEKDFRQKERAWQQNPAPPTVNPPEPEWLRYVLTQARGPALRKEIVALSDGLDQNDPVVQLEAMISLVMDQRYDEAVKQVMPSTQKTRVQSVLSVLSGNAYACAAASRAYSLAGDVERAIPLCIQALELENQNELAWGTLALALAQLKAPDPKFNQIMNVMARNPATAGAFFYNLGVQNRLKEQNAQAAKAFEMALAAQPNNVKAMQDFGEVLLRLGQFEQATRILQNALAINPSDAETHANLGWSFFNQRKHAKAVEELETAVRIDPKNGSYHSDLAAALGMLGKEPESIKEFRLAIELDPSLVDAHYNLANALVRAGELSEAIEHYREVVKLKPSHSFAHFSLAGVLHRLKNLDEAIAEYHEQIRCNPTFAAPYNVLLSIYCDRGEYQNAWNVVELANRFRVKVDGERLARLRRLSPEARQ